MLTGVIIVDHGSRLPQSNQLLEEVAAQLHERFPADYPIVEPAHMELNEPSVASAYSRCVERGATRIVICLYFLGPGKHSTHDIPRLAAQAQQQHPQTTYQITATLGLDELMLQLLHKRITESTSNNPI